MAIKKTSRNLFITILDKYESTAQTHEEHAEKVEIVATGENLILASNKKINIKGK